MASRNYRERRPTTRRKLPKHLRPWSAAVSILSVAGIWFAMLGVARALAGVGSLTASLAALVFAVALLCAAQTRGFYKLFTHTKPPAGRPVPRPRARPAESKAPAHVITAMPPSRTPTVLPRDLPAEFRYIVGASRRLRPEKVEELQTAYQFALDTNQLFYDAVILLRDMVVPQHPHYVDLDDLDDGDDWDHRNPALYLDELDGISGGASAVAALMLAVSMGEEISDDNFAMILAPWTATGLPYFYDGAVQYADGRVERRPSPQRPAGAGAPPADLDQLFAAAAAQRVANSADSVDIDLDGDRP